ncbi:recombinase family protein [Altererythrobacter fulvus]|uniref:recombinase family protein n=1 Tax=Caenibius fulvus TaxID=2126012 RepID=UPI003018AE9C
MWRGTLPAHGEIRRAEMQDALGSHMRTLIYARYSSQLQNPRSIEDQITACRQRAEAEGWQIVECFHDRAISGAAGIEDQQRPGLAAMLQRLELGGIDQVLTESTDRIARHQGDAFAVREQIEYHGARLFTLMDGVIDDITGTIKGLFDARTRKDLAQRVRRGHRGNIAEGKAASGVAYGYRRVTRFDDKGEPIRGLREIEPTTAAIVLRIFAEYAAGDSPRTICGRLNAEGIPGPRGGIWRAAAIAGHRSNGFGVLANPIYIGRLLYGRSQSVVDPRTRKRVMRPGDGQIASGDAPHLRIVPDDLWQSVQAQLEQRSTGRPERQRRPRHLLSGLGKCGVCGRGWIITRGDYFGCSSVIDANACTNRRLIRKDQYERRVLEDLREKMLAPDVVAAYLAEYRQEYSRRTRETASERSKLERRQGELARKVERLVAAIADGASQFTEIREALTNAKAEKADIDRVLASFDAIPQIALHPGLARQYQQAIEQLETELADETTRALAGPRLRKLIARIVVTPSEEKRGVDIEVIRHIDEVLSLTRRTA